RARGSTTGSHVFIPRRGQVGTEKVLFLEARRGAACHRPVLPRGARALRTPSARGLSGGGPHGGGAGRSSPLGYERGEPVPPPWPGQASAGPRLHGACLPGLPDARASEGVAGALRSAPVCDGPRSITRTRGLPSVRRVRGVFLRSRGGSPAGSGGGG